jgi:recyclin-1
VNGVEFSGLEAFMTHILSVIEREGSLVARVFPEEADVLIHFADKISNEAVCLRGSSEPAIGV